METVEIPPLLFQASAEAHPLYEWIVDTIGPYIKGRILEMNSGIHSLSRLFIEHNRPIHLSNANSSNVQLLKETFKGVKAVRDIHEFDFMAHDFQQRHSSTFEVFDTVLALNLSISNFMTSVDNIKYVLPKEGTLAMVLPADTYLYNGLDQNLDDWKKYNWNTIMQITHFGFSIMKVRYFNLPLDKEQHEFAHTGLSALVIYR